MRRFPRTKLTVSRLENPIYSNGPLTPINRAAFNSLAPSIEPKAKHTSELPSPLDQWGPEYPEGSITIKSDLAPWIQSLFHRVFGHVRVKGASDTSADATPLVECSCGRCGYMDRTALIGFDPKCPHCRKKDADTNTGLGYQLPSGWYRNRPIVENSGKSYALRGKRIGMFTCEGLTQAANTHRTYYVYQCDCGIYTASRTPRTDPDKLCPLCETWVENKIRNLHKPLPNWWPSRGGVLEELGRTVEVLKNELDKSK